MPWSRLDLSGATAFLLRCWSFVNTTTLIL
jgi:hypothetical protein